MLVDVPILFSPAPYKKKTAMTLVTVEAASSH